METDAAAPLEPKVEPLAAALSPPPPTPPPPLPTPLMAAAGDGGAATSSMPPPPPVPLAAAAAPGEPVGERFTSSARLEHGSVAGGTALGVIVHGPWRDITGAVGAQSRRVAASLRPSSRRSQPTFFW